MNKEKNMYEKSIANEAPCWLCKLWCVCVCTARTVRDENYVFEISTSNLSVMLKEKPNDLFGFQQQYNQCMHALCVYAATFVILFSQPVVAVLDVEIDFFRSPSFIVRHTVIHLI